MPHDDTPRTPHGPAPGPGHDDWREGPPYAGPAHPQRRPRPGGTGPGIPDGLLLAGLVFLLGLTLFTWTATGLSGLLAHGAWPDGVTFTRTPMALRALISRPHDLPGAWPDAHASQLSGYGLFWGLFISQLMVLLVLALFVLGTVTRARAVRAARRAQRAATGGYAAPTGVAAPEGLPGKAAPPTRPQQAADPAPVPVPAAPTSPAPPPPPPAPVATPVTEPAPVTAPAPLTADDPYARVHDAPGALLVATADPALWAATKDARAKLGPVHVFDPTHLCDTPVRLRWSPHHGCAAKPVAAARASALLAPLRSPRPVDSEVHAAAETLLRCWLHAAAVDARPFREVHRWALAASSPTDPVRILRSHAKAAPGAAGELEATLTAHAERRQAATELVRRALAPLSQLHVRNACTAARADRVALESFAAETGTLYVVGADPEILPILNALTQSVVELGRRMAARSSPGRLDPPLTTVLDLPPGPDA